MNTKPWIKPCPLCFGEAEFISSHCADKKPSFIIKCSFCELWFLGKGNKAETQGYWNRRVPIRKRDIIDPTKDGADGSAVQGRTSNKV